MKKVAALTTALLLTGSSLFAQTEYFKLHGQASDAYGAKKYKESGQFYDQAFRQSKAQPSSGDFYNAACSWALTGDATKAFQYLDRAIVAGWENIAHLKEDADLTTLHIDKRWQPMLAKLEATLAKTEANYNKPLKQQLDSVYTSDQGVRRKISGIEKKYGMKSAEMEALWKEMAEIDAHNQKIVVALLEKHGWPTKAEVGRTGSETVFLVIQHADLATQEKYFPLAKQATERGDLMKPSLALLEDRILVRKGKPQIYGSQLHSDPTTNEMVFYPIEDEAHVDERRAMIGLQPLASYAKLFGLDYKPPVK